ncbi:MAG: FtsX-like permease family protein, partial [Deltaproteobacteria bacterium]
METFIKDLRFAIRGLRRTPGFTVAAVLALALGIGATTAIFSVVHAVLLQSLGFGDEQRLVWVTAEQRGYGWKHGGLSPPEVVTDLRAFPLFEASGGVTRQTASLLTDRAERVEILAVTSGFFEALRVQPLFGRTFTHAEDMKGNDGVVLISASAWRRRFGADPSVVGRTITLDGRPHQIIGVLPEGFSYDGQRDFCRPIGFSQEQVSNARGYRFIEVVARLRPGVTLEATRKALSALAARIVQDHPNNYPKEFGWGLLADPIRDRFTSTTREPLLVLLGAVLLVLLIACANVANLLLARSAQRGREFAVRAAIGASRARIVRQLLTEGLAMAVAGATLGLMLAMWSLSALLASAPRQIRDLGNARLSAPVLGFSIALTGVTTLIFALLPALRASKVDLVSSLKDGAHGTAHGGRLRSFLVAAQVAISIFLLAGAGLMLRSFGRLVSVSPGFEVEGAMTAVLAPAGPTYDMGDGDVGGTLPGYAARRRYFADAIRAASALPGAQATGGIDRVPTVRGWSQTYFIEGFELRPGEPNPTDEMRFVMPGYFAAMRQPLIAGRDFTAADDAKAGPVVIVNQAWVRRYFPGRDVIGKRFRIDE